MSSEHAHKEIDKATGARQPKSMLTRSLVSTQIFDTRAALWAPATATGDTIRSNLARYTESTSWFRLLAVCLLIFSPAFTVAVLVELLPLQSPSEGWRTNWVYWIRMPVTTMVVSIGVSTSIIAPEPSFKIMQAVLIAFGATIGSILQLFIFARLWCFPVPFAIIITTPAWQVGLLLSAWLVARANGSQHFGASVKAAMPLVQVQIVLMAVYSSYNAVFVRLDSRNQVAFTLVLPAAKYFLNRLLARVGKGVPATSAWSFVSVKLFDALYLFKCMQSAGSRLSGVMMIAVDLAQNIYHMYRIRKRVKQVKALAALSGNSDCHASVQRSIHRIATRSRSLLASEPMDLPRNSVMPGPSSDIAEDATSLDHSVEALLQECEHVLVTEFIECAVPLFYALYMVTLFHLPNARFYPELKRLDQAQLLRTVGNITLYATLECASLLYMHVFLSWHLRISAMHLLAFVLERDVVMLQSVFMAWVLLVLEFTLVHNGT